MLCVCRQTEKTLSAAGVTLGLCAAFWPLGLWYVRRLADGGDEPLGAAVLGVLAVFVFNDRKRIDWYPGKTRLGLAALFLLLYLLGTLGLPPMLRCVPAMLCAVFLLGWQRRPAWLALMLLSLPVVASLQFYLGYPMRLFSAEATRLLVWPFFPEVTREGTTLLLGGKSVGVDPPCSGVRTLWTGMVATNVIAAMRGMGWLKTASFNAFAVVLLLLANSLRAALLFAPESGVTAIPEAAHSGAGLLCYLAVFGILAKLSAPGTVAVPSRSVY